MTSPGHGAFIVPDWPAPARVRAASTLRGGGVSQGPYASLNLGTAVGDDAGSVTRNRQILAEMLNLPAEPHWLKQVHGTTVLDLDLFDISTRSSDVLAVPPAADGAVTSRPGLPCAVLTADCLPVLLCDTGGTRVGVAHAGWRGLAGGVLESTVRRMGIEPRRLMAWLGPGIGADAYEVGAEVMEAFIAVDPATAECFKPNDRGRRQADLYGLARQRLQAAGVEAIYGGGGCTHTESERFFSHRREAPCGRMATVIWLQRER